MGGVIGLTLTACTTDSVYDDVDQQTQQDGSQYQTNSFNNSNSGQYGPNPGYNWPGINYISPWDIWFRNKPVQNFGVLQPWYYITNGNIDDPTPYHLKATAYVGLAYFDGKEDGVFNDYDKNISIPLALNLGGNYPNLYGGSFANPAQGQEAGRLVRVNNPFTVPSYPHPESSLRIESKYHHLADGSLGSARYPNLPGADKFFFFGNLTGPERQLLYDYGKVFFYEVEVIDKYTGATVLTTIMHPEIKTLPNSSPDDHWQPIKDQAGNHLKGNAPSLGPLDLYYYHDTNMGQNPTIWYINNPFNGNQCNSYEVVFHVPTPINEIDIDGTYKLKLGFFASGQTGWINSALHLSLGSH